MSRIKTYFVSPILFLLYSATLYASAPTFHTTATLPSAGVRLRTLSRSYQTPLPPAQRYVYRSQTGKTVQSEERYDPFELWYRNQHLAQWMDPDKNVMILAVVKNSFPGFETAHVSLPDYERILKQNSRDLTGTDTQSLSDWVMEFCGSEIVKMEPLRFLPFKINSAVSMSTADGKQIIYLFQAHHRMANQSNARLNTFMVQLQLSNPSHLEKTRENFESRFFDSLEFFSPQKPSDSSTVVENISNLEDWWHVDTSAYTIISNQKLGNRQLIRDLQNFLDPMRTIYEILIPTRATIDEKAVVRLFATQEEYKSYVGETRHWTAGVWDGSRRELVIRPITRTRYSEQRARILRTIYHEAFHQYIYHALLPHNTGAWFNEGHASLFEYSTFKNSQIIFEEHAPYVELVGTLPLKTLLSLTYDQFYSGNEKNKTLNYAAAWSFIYYLRRAAVAEPDFPFKNFCSDYLNSLSKTGREADSIRIITDRYDLLQLEENYRHFWKSNHRRKAVQRTFSIIP